jgi:hypothetical protein
VPRSLILLLASALLLGCQSAPADRDRINWIDLLDDPSQKVVVHPERFVPEAFTGDALGFRETPTALELLRAYRYKNAEQLAGAKGLWPTVPLPTGHRLPDPRYPIRKLLGWEYEPSYVIVREANALILRTEQGTRVVPIDPDQPIGFPEDGSPAQRRARNAFLRGFDRDHRALDQPAPRVDPRVEP